VKDPHLSFRKQPFLDGCKKQCQEQN